MGRAATRGAGACQRRRTLGPRHSRSEHGAATAETVMVLPLLVVTTLALVWLRALAAAQTRAVDAAREVARAVARDEPRGTALALGRRIAPAGADIVVSVGAGDVEVSVRAEVRGPGGMFGFVPGAQIEAEAVAALESP